MKMEPSEFSLSKASQQPSAAKNHKAQRREKPMRTLGHFPLNAGLFLKNNRLN